MTLTTILLLSLVSGILAQNSGASSESGEAPTKTSTNRLPGERLTPAQRSALAALDRDVAWAFSDEEVPTYLVGSLGGRLFPQDPVAEAEATLRAHAATFRMSPADGFTPAGVDIDKSGTTHVRMAQTFDGRLVPDRQLIVHMDASAVRGISGNFAPDLAGWKAAPVISPKTADREAVALASGPIPRNYLLNAGFESGSANWLGQSYTWVGGTYGGGSTGTPPLCGGATVTPARIGNYCACPGGNGRTSTEWIAQTVTIPSAAVSGTLSFYLRIATTELPSPYDYLKIEIWNATGTSLLTTLPTRFANNSGYPSWQNVSMPFPVTYRGSTVQIRLAVTEDSSNATTFYVDDLSLTFAGLSL